MRPCLRIAVFLVSLAAGTASAQFTNRSSVLDGSGTLSSGGGFTNNGTLQLANAQTIYGYLNQAAGSTLDLMFAGKPPWPVERTLLTIRLDPGGEPARQTHGGGEQQAEASQGRQPEGPADGG